MSQTNKVNRGSVWRKWDLHVHTPGTALNDQFAGGNDDEKWNAWLQKIEVSDVSVIGVTDYFSISNYLKVLKNKEEGRLKNIHILFPNVELRILPSTSDGKCINIHCIFNPLIKDELENRFFQQLSFEYQGRPYKANKSDFIALGRAYTNNLNLEEFVAYKKGVEQFKVDFSRLRSIFKNDPNLREDTLIVISNNSGDGNSGIQHHSLAATREEIYRFADAIFSANPNDCKYFLGQGTDRKNEIIRKYSNLKPCLHGSDAHSLEELLEPKKDRFCWVKAETNFEGLKQIIYEPELRVFIGSTAPKHSPNVINSFTLNIPSNAKVGDDDFCFADLKRKFYLNPYFNCFIGGRGTGKSTILSFFGLRSIHPDSSEEMWNKLSPQGFDPKDGSVFLSEGTEIFEFLGQSEVEIFARDKIKFTQAIYDRANSRSENELKEFELNIEDYKSNLDTIIQNIAGLRRLEQEKLNVEREKRTLEKGLSILSSEDYKDVTLQITEKSKELQALRDWRNKVDELRSILQALTGQEELIESSDSWEYKSSRGTHKTEVNESSNEFYNGNQHIITYSKAYQDVIAKIGEISSLLEKENFIDALKEELVLQNTIAEEERQMKDILEKSGLSTENVAQIKSAPQKITILSHNLSKLDEKIDNRKKSIKNYEIILKDLEKTMQSYEQKLSEILQPLKEILEKQYNDNQGLDIKKISLEYSFNYAAAWHNAAKEFYESFKFEYGTGERLNEVCNFICENTDVFAGQELVPVQTLLKSASKTQKYLTFLVKVFEDRKNFQIFRCIRDKHLYDVKKYKLIQVRYHDKDIENASFGQRCTAVIVVLMLFGNYPLIIDEPEAHLDGSLIANYLVPLLKSKKIDRQIIFATHNANFVVNGDAEKIFVLEILDKHTQFIETTIESLNNRDKLLKLEGGEEAFLIRKKKYQFN